MIRLDRDHLKVNMASKSSIWPMILAALVGGSIAFVFLQLGFRVKIQPAPSPKDGPTIIDTAKPAQQPSVQAQSPASSLQRQTGQPDGLRVSNRSPSPVRVVLMSQADVSQPNLDYRSPVHWDFSPQEGGQAGLLLSLPESQVRLTSGDVLIAFALDGSRRYWGPYIIGETPLPVRSPETQEWQLLLRP